MFSLPVPYNIAVPDNHFFHAKFNEKSYWVDCELINGSTVVSMTKDPLDWLVMDEKDGVHIAYAWKSRKVTSNKGIKETGIQGTEEFIE